MPSADDHEVNADAYEIRLGTSTVRFEPPDLVWITRDGVMSVPEALQFTEEITRFAQGKERILSIIDARHLGNTSSEVRKILVTRTVPLFSAAVYITVKPQHRMALAAMYPATTPVAFVASEAEARAWIDDRRRALSSRPPRDGRHQ